MRNKTPKLVHFIEGLHEFVSAYPELRERADIRSGVELKPVVQALIAGYLEFFFMQQGHKNAKERAIDAFYSDAYVLEHIADHTPVFGERKIPDFIIVDPYLVAIHYEEGNSVSTVEEGIGKSIPYTLSGNFDFVYCLIHDQSEDRRISRASGYKLESSIMEEIWVRYNVYLRFV